MELSNTEYKKIEAILQALYGRWNMYPQEEVLFLPILDLFSLLYQKPLAITFFDKESLLYTTLQDPELTTQYKNFFETSRPSFEPISVPITQGEKTVYVTLHAINSLNNFEILSQYDHAKLSVLFSKMCETDWGVDVLRDIVHWLYHQNTTSNSLEHHSEEPEVTLDEFNKIISPFRTVLDKVFKDIWNAQSLRVKSSPNLTTPNLFCVIRTATMQNRRGLFNYTARILLTKKQKEIIIEWLEKEMKIEKADDFLSQIEIPLGKGARSIADSSYASGLIDFSHEQAGEGRDDYGDNPSDLKRGETEKLIYSQIFNPNRVLFIPIHVEGVAWLSLFTLTSAKNNEEKSWQHNYHVYWDLVPSIGTNIRANAEDAFIEAVANCVKENVFAYNDVNDFIYKTNNDLVKISRIYPYNIFQLKLSDQFDKSSSERIIDLPNDMLCIITHKKNIYFNTQFEYYTNDQRFIKNVINAIKIPINEKRKIEMLRKYESADALSGVGHFLKNRVSPARTDFYDINKDFRDYLSNSPDAFLSDLLERYENTASKVRSVYNTGILLNILTLRYQKGINPFTEDPKEEWISFDSLSLKETFLRFQGYSFKGRLPTFKFTGNDLTVSPFISTKINDTIKKIRPNDFFYEEILVELINNACTNGSKNEQGFVEIEVDFDLENNCCTLKNEIFNGPYKWDDLLKKFQTEFNPIAKDTIASGTGYLSRVLKIADAGSLSFKISHDNLSNCYFHTRLTLKTS